MSNEEKMALLEDMFEVDKGEISPETELESIDSWDSMMKLTLIVLMDEECGKALKSDDIKGFKTLQDLMDYMD